MPVSRAPSARPLVVSTDEDLLDDVLRLLAAAGAEAEVATGGPALRRAHREAPLVLLGADVLGAAPVRDLPRRPGVVVVAAAELPGPAWAAAVELGAERVAVLPADEGWLLARAGDALRSPVERGRLVAVGGSCGGAGASTLAVALALTAAPDADGVLLVDTDGWGGGLDLLLGGEGTDGLRWPELSGLRGRVGGEALMACLPEVAGVSVLAASRSSPAPPPVEAVVAVVEAARAGGRPVVVDLPRSAPREVTEAVLAEAELAVLLVPARLRSAVAARLLVDGVPDDPPAPWAAARLVVRRGPGGLTAAEVADVVGRPVLAELAPDRSAPLRSERGEPPLVSARSPLGSVARRLLAAATPAEVPA
ncbi:septum site-determining protein Ssd [Blastococcus sp. SYSU D00820]